MTRIDNRRGKIVSIFLAGGFNLDTTVVVIITVSFDVNMSEDCSLILERSVFLDEQEIHDYGDDFRKESA